ncbi:MAG: ATP synthase F1 subunit epsilon [Firmicutes bacterium]|jgi:F-type H+-transporting ATPase subunit epsilon|nr:ATP synthase F1 subunit epsilon [Bacillota bacterium]
MEVEILSPEGIVFRGQAESAVLPTADGYVGILPGHARLAGRLGPGTLRVRAGGGVETVEVENGIVRVRPDKVTVLLTGVGEHTEKDGRRAHRGQGAQKEWRRNVAGARRGQSAG